MIFSHAKRRFRWTLSLAALSAASLIGCGGGDSPGTTSTPGQQQAPVARVCPKAVTADIWLDRRLECLTAGDVFIDISSFASTGAITDRAFVISEQVLDSSYSNLIAPGKSRYFKHFVCVKNAPLELTGTSGRLSLASDLNLQMGLGSPSQRPAGIGAASLGSSGGNQAGFVEMACDPARHPLIVDFATKKIVSVNQPAVAFLEIYDY
jgi:hypothetical protein